MKMQSVIYGKKGQFKLQQMAFMLVAVVLFFVLVGLFWITYQSGSLRQQATELAREQSILISGYLSGSSEFACSGELGSYCIDMDKTMVLKDNPDYGRFWPVSYIKIRVLDGEEIEECDSGNYPNCNLIEIYENKQVESEGSIESFVSLCRYERREDRAMKICELGKLNIGYDLR